MGDHSKNLESNAPKPYNLEILGNKIVIFGPQIVLEAVLEPNLAPRGAKTGSRGGWEAQKSPQEAKKTAKKAPRWPKKAPRRPIWRLLGPIFGENWGEKLVKMGVKIRKCRKRRTQQKP